MSIEENSKSCCTGGCGGHKKICLIVSTLVLLFVVGVVGCFVAQRKFKERRNLAGNGCDFGMMTKVGSSWGRAGCINPTPDPLDQFYPPQDALKNGEITLLVNDLESARVKVESVSAKNEGVVVGTKFVYAPRGNGLGYVVVQVPVEKFEVVFADLKDGELSVLKEVTQKLPEQPYPIIYDAPASSVQPETQGEDESLSVAEPTSTTQVSAEAAVSAPEIASMPSLYKPTKQDKGYVKISFVADKGRESREEINRKDMLVGLTGFGYDGFNMRNNFVIVLVVKLVLLIVLLVLLIFVLRKILKRYHGHRVSVRQSKMQGSRKIPVVHFTAKTPLRKKAKAVRVVGR